MFNPASYDNSRAGGHGVLQIVDDTLAPDEAQRFVPLQQSTLAGRIAGPLAELTLTQTFAFSAEVLPRVIEAHYRFPLPGDAAVTGVTVRFGDVEIVATLKARPAAEAEYAAAKDEQKQAALLTRESPDVFTLQVAGVKPDEPVTINTRYVQLARRDGADWSLRIPLTTAPRYVREDDLQTSHARGQPLAVLRDPGHRFGLDLLFLDQVTVRSVTHELALTARDAGLHVALAGGEVLPDRDCVLRWTMAQAEERPALHAQVYLDGDNDAQELYFLVEVAPPARPAAATVPREVIVLVDHSGSMGGPKWAAADWAVERFIRNLAGADRFGLGIFHTTTAWYARVLAAAEAQPVDAAVTWLTTQRESGGTNLGVALEQALSMPRTSGEFAHNVLVITDAEVSDAARVLRLADQEREQPAARRISVLCIDAAPNAFLANELAERGGGLARFLTSDPRQEDITTALDEVLANWDAPLYADLRLVVNRSDLIPAGRRLADCAADDRSALDLGDLPAGVTLWVCGRTSAGTEPLAFQLETADGGVVASTEVVPAALSATMPAIKALYGVHRVNMLETLMTARYDQELLAQLLARMGYDPAATSRAKGDPVYAENRAAWTQDALRALLVQESLRYGLASAETGFVAVRAEAGAPVEATVVVANARPAGWSDSFVTHGSMLGGGVRGMAAMPAAAPMPMMMPGPPQVSAESSFGLMPAASGMQGPRPQWHEVFNGTVQLHAGRAVLFGQSDGDDALPGEVTIKGIRMRVGGEWHGIDQSVRLQLFVGDRAEPRAQVALADLLRHGNRPLNLLRRAGDVVELVLEDPTGQTEGRTLAVELEW